MPVIKDKRVLAGKRKKRDTIRAEFDAYRNDGRTIEWTLDKIISRHGYSESTIMQIVKRQGCYKD